MSIIAIIGVIIAIIGVIVSVIATYYTYRQTKLAEKPPETAEQRPAPEAPPTGAPSPVSEPTLSPSPSPAPSASPSSSRPPTPAPSPNAILKTEPDQKPSPIPLLPEPRQQQVPEPKPTEESFVRRIPQSPCVKANRSDELSLGEPYSDTDVGFYVEYISISALTGVNIRINPMASLKMPGEEKARNVDVYAGFKQSVRTGGCLYTFRVEEVTKSALKFSFNGSR